VRADLAIMSCGGITPAGVSNSHGLLIEIQFAMMHAARRVVLCVDHTKFGRQSISHLCALEVIDTLITDQPPTGEMRVALSRAGVEVIIASAEGSKVTMPGRRKAMRTEEPFTAPEPLPVLAEEKDDFID